MIWPILEARAEIQKYFRSFFRSNENFKICFRDLLTFRLKMLTESWSCVCKLFSTFYALFFRFQQSGRPPSNRPGGSGRFPVQRGGGQSNVQSNYHQQRLRTPYNNQSSNGQMNNGGPGGDNRNNQANRSNYNSNNSSGTPINRNRPNNERPGQQNKSQVIDLKQKDWLLFFSIIFCNFH